MPTDSAVETPIEPTTTPEAVTPQPEVETPTTPAPPATEGPAIKAGRSSELLRNALRKQEEQKRDQAPTSEAPAPASAVDAPATPGQGTEGKVEPQKPTEGNGATSSDELTKLKTELAEKERLIAQKEAEADRERLDRLTKEQLTDLQRKEAKLGQLKEQIDDITAELAEIAEEEGGTNNIRYARAYSRYQTLQETGNELYQAYNATKQQYQSEAEGRRAREFEGYLTKMLQANNLSLDELKTVKTDLKINSPAEVLETALKAKDSKHAAEVEALKKELADTRAQAKKDVEEARKKWDTSSPAAIPPRPTTGGTDSGGRIPFKAGNSGAALRKAFSEKK